MKTETANTEAKTYHLCINSHIVDYPIAACSKHRKAIPNLELSVNNINKYWKEYAKKNNCNCKIHRDIETKILFHGRSLYVCCHLCTNINLIPREFEVWLGYQLDPALKVIRDLNNISYNEHTATDWGHADYALKKIRIIEKYVVDHLLQTEMARE